MSAQKRLDALAQEISAIEQDIATLTAEHAERAQAGKTGVEHIFEQLTQARTRLEGAEMRRAPLERALQAEQDAARAKVAKELTAAADAKLEAIEATLAQALDAAKALAEITDSLDEHTALSWVSAARQAVKAGGSPARRHLANVSELRGLLDRAHSRVRHVVRDYEQRSVHIPVPTKSRAA